MGEVIGRPAPQPEEIRAPERLRADHDASAFDSGASELDDWLRRRALRNEEEGGSRTYVVCVGQRVVGFYSLANGAVMRDQATGKVRRNMPEPVPVMLIGRLAVDRSWHGKGVGRAMVRDAILRTVHAAEIAGIRAILVHAKSAQARAFYERIGFAASTVDPMTLMITVADARRFLGT
jgi:GNAT superfamily N-acetyltransferase